MVNLVFCLTIWGQPSYFMACFMLEDGSTYYEVSSVAKVKLSVRWWSVGVSIDFGI
jgi:hypothetical protein